MRKALMLLPLVPSALPVCICLLFATGCASTETTESLKTTFDQGVAAYGVVTPGRLLSVWGRATNDVWAVGEGGAIVHWDGRVWTLSDSGTLDTLDTVWGDSAGDTWVAGASGTILHHP